DGQGDRLAQPLVLLLGARQRAPDEQAFQSRVHARQHAISPDGPAEEGRVTIPPCTSSWWDAAGSAASWPALWKRTATAWPSSTRTRAPSAACPRGSAAPRWWGSVSTGTTCWRRASTGPAPWR